MDAEEILVVSFTANLGFFARSVAGRARSRGARVTVISDQSQTTFDPDGVGGAGWDWLDARAWCNGSFHPKVIVATSETYATVLVGSGNATPAGWVDNAELWVRLDATAASCPETIPAVGKWLLRLPDLVHLSPGADVAVAAAAKQLTRQVASHRGPELVHNFDGAIWDCLPSGPVDELVISSPFFDEPCSALEHVCDRLRPQQLRVSVQKDFHFDGTRLAAVVGSWAGRIAPILDGRYHHGKLLEWAGPTGRYALMGSPNCTRAALGRTVADSGGNCELAVICELDATLEPPTGEPLEPSELQEHRYIRPKAGPVSLLVAALIEETGTRLFLRRPTVVELRVEMYLDATWIDSGYRVPAGRAEYLCLGWRPGASVPIRLLGSGGEATTAVAATDLRHLAPRQASRRDIGGSGGDFMESATFVGALQEALVRIRASLVATRRINIPTGPRTSPHAGKDEVPSRPGWRDVIERVRVETGERFSWFCLPNLALRAGLWKPPPPVPDDNPIDEVEPTPDEVDRAAQLEAYRQRRIADLRRWCNRAYDPDLLTDVEREARRRASSEAGFDPERFCSEVDILLATVVLAADALAAWPDSDEEATVVTRAVRRLSRPLTDVDLAPDAASAAAVGLWILHRLLATSTELAVTRAQYHGVASDVADLLATLGEQALTDRCDCLATSVRPAPSVDDVFNVALAAVSPDPLAELFEYLDESGIAADVEGCVVRIAGRLAGDGVVQILRWLAKAEAVSPMAIQATSATAGAVTVAWHRPHLVLSVERRGPKGVLYHLPRGVLVSTDPDTLRLEARTEISRWFEDQPMPQIASDTLVACGLV